VYPVLADDSRRTLILYEMTRFIRDLLRGYQFACPLDAPHPSIVYA